MTSKTHFTVTRTNKKVNKVDKYRLFNKHYNLYKQYMKEDEISVYFNLYQYLTFRIE